MKCVFSAPTITEVYLIKTVLENEGIITIVKNEHMAGLAGELPFFESWPQLFVMADEQEETALAVIEDFQKDTSTQDSPPSSTD